MQHSCTGQACFKRDAQRLSAMVQPSSNASVLLTSQNHMAEAESSSLQQPAC